MDSHATAGSKAVSFVPDGGVQGADGATVLHFGDVAGELAAFEAVCVLVSRVPASRISHTGADALELLHRLSTNDLISLSTGQSAMTVLTSERGRVIDVLNVAVVADGRLLLLSESADPNPAIEWIEKFTILEDAELSDVSQELVQFSLIGPAAGGVTAKVFGYSTNPGEVMSVDSPVAGAVLVGSEWDNLPRVDVVVPGAAAGTMWNLLMAAGARPAGEIAFTAARVAHGLPVVGAELTEDANPLEAGLKRLISFTKGCYIGQEVVARLDTYDKLQRRLVALESDGELVTGAELTAAGKRAGVVTSVSAIPVASASASEKRRALGYARRGSWDNGTVLRADGMEVTVRELPTFA
jgi:folate-binding protein YgfZ